VNSIRNITHKDEAKAFAPVSLFALKKMNEVCDQTIPLRVPATIKAALVELSKSDNRSLNNYINRLFVDFIQSKQSVRLVCQNTIQATPQDEPQVLDLDEPQDEPQDEPTPHKAVVKTKAKAKPKAKPKFKTKAKARR
jgi:hypothetical protein